MYFYNTSDPFFFLQEEMFSKWINPLYLNPITQINIQEHFEMNSEIQLQEFLDVMSFVVFYLYTKKSLGR